MHLKILYNICRGVVMKVKFDFVLEAWMQGVEIEADSYEEALRKLYAMDVEDLISEGYIKESDIKQEEGVITEKTVKVRAYDIDYDVEPEDVDENEELTEDELDAKIAEVKESLPSELTFEFDIEPDEDIEDRIADEITLETDWLVNNFKYVIVEER